MSQQKNNIRSAKKSKQITYEHRLKIEAHLSDGLKTQEIAVKIGFHRTSIEREIALGLVEFWAPGYEPELKYSAEKAQKTRDERQKNKCWGKAINYDPEFKAELERLIKSGFSPYAALQQIRNSGEKYKIDICTKTLYNAIDAGEFECLTNADLPTKPRAKRGYRRVRCSVKNTKGTSISDRPESIENRKEMGHWEIDLVIGKQGTKPVILTLVERKTRKSIYILLKNKTQAEVMRALKRARRRYGGDFSEVFKTVTSDNGSEFLDFEGMKKALKCGEIYYAHPYSSWERGSCENGNRLLRRFVPKGTDLNRLTPKQLQIYEDWINNYPRKILGGQSSNMAYVAAKSA